jgi:hypothetical protein
MLILQDVVRNGILPREEIIDRALAGEIPAWLLLPLLFGRLAEDAAEPLADDSPTRGHLLTILEAVEDWFQEPDRGEN